MPQVPYSGAVSIEANYPATPSIHPNANPEAFGAATAAASARFGASLEQAADSIFTRALVMQKEDQDAHAMNASADTTEKIDGELIKYKSQLGLAAQNSYEPFAQSLDKIIADGREGLQSDYAKKVYDLQMRYLRTHTLSSAASHAAAENKSYLIGSVQAAADRSHTIIGMNPESDDVFNTEIKNLSEEAKRAQHIVGWNDTKTTNWYNEQTSKAVAVRAKLIGRDDPTRGQEILDEAAEKGLIDGTTAGQVSDFIRGRRNTILPRIKSADIIDGVDPAFAKGKTATSNARYAIGMVEGSGSYNPPHKYVKSGTYAGQKALGAYGVMQGNLQPWLAEARAAGVELPSKITEAEFLRNHDVQDALFDFKWGQIRKGVNSDLEAAVVWFSGPGGLEKYRKHPEAFAQVNDGHTSGPTYLQRFTKFLGDKSTPEERKEIAHAKAEELSPGDPEFKDIMRDKLDTDWNHQQAIKEKQDQIDTITVRGALAGDETGKLPTSVEQLDPKVQDLIASNPKLQLAANKILKANAQNLYSSTEENQAQVQTWWAKLTNENKTPAQMKEAINEDFVSKPWPRSDVRKLIKLQNDLIDETKKPPPMDRAMGVLKEVLSGKGLDIRPGDDRYNQLSGELKMILEEERAATGKPIPNETIREYVGQLLTKFTLPKYWMGTFDSSDYEYARPVDPAQKAKILAVYKQKYPNSEPSDAELQRFDTALRMVELYDKKAKEHAD